MKKNEEYKQWLERIEGIIVPNSVFLRKQTELLIDILDELKNLRGVYTIVPETTPLKPKE